MAEPPDQMPAPTGRGRLRASHADRDQVIGILKAAFVRGMLAKDEFDERVSQTLASQTYTELAAISADLPIGLTAANSPRPAPVQSGEPVLRPGRWVGVATALYASAWAYELFLSPHGGNNPSTPLLIFGGFYAYLIVWILAVGQMIVSRQDKHSGRQLPPPTAADPGWRPISTGTRPATPAAGPN